MSNTAPLVLVDGSSYLYRAFHALPPLINSKGQPTGATKGVINMIRRLCKDYPESPIIVIFDAKGKTFRDDICANYKANRPPMPDDLRPQVEPIHKIINAMGLPLVVEDGVEADDVIGTLALQASKINQPVIISTGDKDMAQLVDENVTLINTMTDTVLDPAGVVDKFGIPPELIIDFLALMGDKVDNIPGVPGVGEKTALGLLQGIGCVDDIYNNLDKVASLSIRGAKTLGAKLEKHHDEARLSYLLATIKTDVELHSSAEDYVRQYQQQGYLTNNAQLYSLYSELEFNTWLKEFDSAQIDSAVDESVQKPAQEIEVDYQTILDIEHLQKWLERLDAAEIFAFDTETTSLDYNIAEVVGVSFAVKAGEAAYLPFGHSYLDAPEQLSRELVFEKLKPLLENDTKKKVGQNLKYDKHVLANHNIELRGIAEDTMLMSYVLNSTGTRHDMDSLAMFYLDVKTTHFEDIAGKGAKQISFDQIALEQAAPYAAEDADITLRLYHVLKEKLDADPQLDRVYREIELPLLPVICEIEANGTYVDDKQLLAQSDQLAESIRALEARAFELAGDNFNLGSPKQLQEVLFEKLKLPVIKKTPKGQPSTAEPILQELALDYPLPKVIMEYRGLSKLKSTYTDKLPLQIRERTGRIHTSYHQAVTATGRLSSSDPNLQNIPIRTEEGRRVRQAFVATLGRAILAADYSQIELRIMAHLSEDKGLIDAFNHGLDVHKATAAEVFNVSLESVSSDQRRKAKAINFGLIYGMSAFGLAKQLDIGRHDAQRYIDTYFDRYPGVLRYMDATKSEAAEKGYVETLFGRRLYLPDINARNGQRRQAAERTAINAPMQGTAADIIKIAMLKVGEYLHTSAVDALMIMQVHDELVFELAEDIVEDVSEQVIVLMQSAADLRVPLVVEAGSGKNWDQAH